MPPNINHRVIYCFNCKFHLSYCICHKRLLQTATHDLNEETFSTEEENNTQLSVIQPQVIIKKNKILEFLKLLSKIIWIGLNFLNVIIYLNNTICETIYDYITNILLLNLLGMPIIYCLVKNYKKYNKLF